MPDSLEPAVSYNNSAVSLEPLFRVPDSRKIWNNLDIFRCWLLWIPCEDGPFLKQCRPLLDEAVAVQRRPLLDQAVAVQRHPLLDQAVAVQLRPLMDQAVAVQRRPLMDQAVAVQASCTATP